MVTSSRKSKEANALATGKKTKEQTMIYITLHSKLKIEQHELHTNLG
jgi:hypothetical protein